MVGLRCVLGLLALAVSCAAAPAQGVGTAGSPPPNECGVAGSLTVLAPGKAALTGGGSITIDTLLYFEQTNPIGAPCAPPPFTAFVEVTLSGPGGNLVGLAIVPVNPGFNVVPVNLTTPAGPARVNSGTAVARIQTGGTGQAWIESLPFQIEVVPPEPAAPSLPEGISMEFIGNGVSQAHPGDERSLTLRITNANPTDFFSGALDVRAPNAALAPTFASGAYGAAWSIGDPDPEVGGFNVAIPPNGQDGFGCVILEQLPAPAPAGSTFIEVPPSASLDIEVEVRSRTLSANGSAGQGVAILQGMLGGGGMEDASAFFAHGADAFLPPDYACKGNGATSFIEPVAPDTLNATGAPDGVDFFDARIRVLNPQLFDMNGAPIAASVNFSSPPIGPFRGRLQTEFTPMPGQSIAPADEMFSIEIPIELTAQDFMGPRTVTLRNAQVATGLPTGIDDVAPYLVFRADTAGGNAPLAFFDGVHQWSGEAMLDSGDTVPLQFLSATITPFPSRDGYVLSADVIAPSGTLRGLDPLIIFGRFKNDFRSTGLPGCGCDFNGDFVVDFSDLNILLSGFGTSGLAPDGDCDASGMTDFSDLNILLTNFSSICP